MARFVSHPELRDGVMGDIDGSAADLELFLNTAPSAATSANIVTRIGYLQHDGVSNEDINTIIDASPQPNFHLPPTPGLSSNQIEPDPIVIYPHEDDIPPAHPPLTNPPLTTEPPSGIVHLPLIGPIIGQVATATGFSPTIIAVAAVVLGLWAFDGGGGGGSKSGKIW